MLPLAAIPLAEIIVGVVETLHRASTDAKEDQPRRRVRVVLPHAPQEPLTVEVRGSFTPATQHHEVTP